MSSAWVVALVGIAVGLLGYRLFHAALGLYGFVVGGILGAGLLWHLVGQWPALLGGLVAGLLGAAAVSVAERAAFFLAGAVLGWFGGLALGAWLGLAALSPAVGAVGALICGVAGVFAERLVVTAGTALAGAWLVVHGAGAALLGSTLDPTGPLPPLTSRPELVWIGLTLLFAALQLGEARRSAPERPSR